MLAGHVEKKAASRGVTLQCRVRKGSTWCQSTHARGAL